MIKSGCQAEKNGNHYLKYWNNFAADCNPKNTALYLRRDQSILQCIRQWFGSSLSLSETLSDNQWELIQRFTVGD